MTADCIAHPLALRSYEYFLLTCRTNASEVPACVRTANVQNDPLEDSDKLAIILCPQSYEADYIGRVIDSCSQKGLPLVMVNPNLINMDQGFGLRKFQRIQIPVRII